MMSYPFKRRILTALSILLGFSMPVAQGPTIADVYKLPCGPADHLVHYGDDSLQYGALRIPSGAGPHPVAVLIHGGCWVSFVADLRYTEPLADALRNEGIATWNIEYSRIGDKRGGWPGTFEDVALGLDFVRKLSRTHDLDTTRVILIGHSAGAHLALWASARHNITPENQLYSESPLRVRGVVAMAAPVDPENIIELTNYYCGDSLMVKLIGGLPQEVPQNYNSTSPMRLLPFGVPQRLIVGDEDIPELLEHLARYADSAKALNDDVSLDTIAHVVHNELAIPGSIAWLRVRKTILTLLGD